jgi:RHS repeat-associated protein
MADERGSIVSVTDSAGVVITLNKYDEFGIPQSANQGRFGYTGQAWLNDVGMWHYKARTYSPTLGRFMQTDPIGYGDGMNWYNYVGGDGVNLSDSSGLCEGEGEEPCGWKTWPQWMKQSYCDQVSAVGCEFIDPTTEVGGRLYHLNLYSSLPKNIQMAILAQYAVTSIIVVARTNNSKFSYADLIPRNPPESYIAWLSDGRVLQGRLVETGETDCGDGTIQVAFGFPNVVESAIRTGLASLIGHGHPSSFGVAGQIPAGGDDIIPGFGVPLIGMTSANVWVVWRDAAGLNLQLASGAWPSGFNPATWVAQQAAGTKGNTGRGGKCNK